MCDCKDSSCEKKESGGDYGGCFTFIAILLAIPLVIYLIYKFIELTYENYCENGWIGLLFEFGGLALIAGLCWGVCRLFGIL